MVTVALAGKPNAGKSTFFEAATRAEVEVGNYPFTTIDPNRGVTHVRTECPCTELDRDCDADTCRGGKRYVPVELLDVAGLVPGAHEGRGLGNQFLDALTNADVILNVVDAAGATNAEGEPVEIGEHDPTDDVGFVETELDRWIADIVTRNWEGIERQSRSPSFDLEEAVRETFSGLGASRSAVSACLRERDYPEDPLAWSDDDRFALAKALRRRTKPIVVVANKADVAPDDLLEAVLEAGNHAIPATADGELALRRAADADTVAYDPGDLDFEIIGDVSASQREGLDRIAAVMDRFGGTGVQSTLDTAVYDVLDRVTVYPVQDAANWADSTGTVLPDAHLLPRGSTPRDLAYAIHSDIGEGYLHAVDARSGRDVSDAYELEEGDVIKVVSTAT